MTVSEANRVKNWNRKTRPKRLPADLRKRRSINDYKVNCKAEFERKVILAHLERRQELPTQTVRPQGVKADNAPDTPITNPQNI